MGLQDIRDEQGRYKPTSSLAPKSHGVRLYKEDEDLVQAIARKRNTNATQIVRDLVHEALIQELELKNDQNKSI